MSDVTDLLAWRLRTGRPVPVTALFAQAAHDLAELGILPPKGDR